MRTQHGGGTGRPTAIEPCAPAPGIRADLHRPACGARWLRLTTPAGALPGGALVTIDDWLRVWAAGTVDGLAPGLQAGEIAAAYGAKRFRIALQEPAGERELLVASLGAVSRSGWSLRLDRREFRVPVVAWYQLSGWALAQGERQRARQLREHYRLDPVLPPRTRRTRLRRAA